MTVTQDPVQLQIQRSLVVAKGTVKPIPPGNTFGSNNILLLTFYNQPTYPLVNLGNFFFIDAPNVSRRWNIKNASLNVRDFSMTFMHEAETEPHEIELEYTLEYLIRSAGVPILVAIERRNITSPNSPTGFFEEKNKEIIVNYEASRSQFVVPGSGLELAITIRNALPLRGILQSTSELYHELQNMELNISLERVPN